MGSRQDMPDFTTDHLTFPSVDSVICGQSTTIDFAFIRALF